MNSNLYLNGTLLRLSHGCLIGEGGEALVYDISALQSVRAPTALKVWKPPTYPDYQGDTPEKRHNREAAARRLHEYPQKMRLFPKTLPSHVITPLDLVTANDGSIRGYTMTLLGPGGVAPLLSYFKRDFRRNISDDAVRSLFLGLHDTVNGTHLAGVVIGDFNPLNVLVRENEAFLIDADSMQFGGFPCYAFTTRYVDPLLCKADAVVLNQPHNCDSDWYSYATLLFEGLTFTHPYGGVYAPRSTTQRIKHDHRPLQRISVFHSAVRYPDKAMPLDHLDDDLLHYFQAVFSNTDRRGEFPKKLLQRISWTHCPACGTVHMRGRCPTCAHAAPRSTVIEERRGKMIARRIFVTSGQILHATMQEDKLRWLYHQQNVFHREDERQLIAGEATPAMRYRILGDKTCIATGSQLTVVTPGKEVERLSVDLYRGQVPMFDTDNHHLYWQIGGTLNRSDVYAPKFVGTTLADHSMFWVGPEFGCGFYRAGQLWVAFIIDTKRPGLNDNVQLPRIEGQLTDATAYFSKHRAWLLTAAHNGHKTINRCTILDALGQVMASTEAEEDDGSWLGSIRGKTAATLRAPNGELVHSLFSASPSGLERIDETSGQLALSVCFPDSARMVRSSDRLHYSRHGIYLVRPHEIRLLTMADS